MIYSVSFVLIFNQIVSVYPVFADLNIFIIGMIYILLLFLIASPFLPRRGNKKSIVGIWFRKVKKVDKSKFSIGNRLKKKINLKGNYKPSLIAKCKCGFILTGSMKKCPNCLRENPQYIISDKKVKKKMSEL